MKNTILCQIIQILPTFFHIRAINISKIYNGLNVKFESSDITKIQIKGTALYTGQNLKEGLNVINLELKATGVTTMNDSCHILAFDENRNLIGKLVVQTGHINVLNTNVKEVTFIKVLTSATNSFQNISYDKNAILDRLNNHSYNQAFMGWTAKADSMTCYNLPFKNKTTELTNTEKKAVSKALITQYGSKLTTAEDKSYVFILDVNIGTVNGRASNPLQILGNKKYVIIMNRAINLLDTYVHELGHNRTLSHPFDYGVSEKSTDNYMDYTGDMRSMFFKKQCDILFNNLKE